MERPPSGSKLEICGPQRPGSQGLGSHQAESGDRAIRSLLCDPAVREHVDLVITFRNDAYEVWAERGMVRFQRLNRNGKQEFRILETIGQNPIADQRHTPLASCEEETLAARASGYPAHDANEAFIEPPQLSYPFAYERIAQLFDSPHAPDLIVSPRCYAFGLQRGQHGALDVVQSRAPLAFAGPGIRPGLYETAVRHVDIAPTICHLMGFPKIDGRDWSGRRSSERGVAPDVYLERQDGRVLEEILSGEGPTSQRVYLVVFDGLSHSELLTLVNRDSPAVRHLRRLLDRAAIYRFGSIVNFPSITWPSHSTILTGAWCGHHDIVNPVYYLRERREAVAPQGQGLLTEGYLGRGVETLYEAFHRVLGTHALTVNIHEPQGRGADHAALEQRIVGSRTRLRALTAEFVEDIHPRYAAEGKEGVHREAVLDARGLAQIVSLLEDPDIAAPSFVAHEFALTDGAGHDYGPHGDGLREAIAETDRRLGKVLDVMEEQGLLDSTLFVFTSDHGMAAQRTELRANPARHPERAGLRTITGEPMIWLRDLAVVVEPALDGRTARITVADNDPDESGERPPIRGAEIVVYSQADRLLARVTTNEAGVAGVVTPPDVPSHEIYLKISHADFNPRHLRLDGSCLTGDLRQELYGG